MIRPPTDSPSRSSRRTFLAQTSLAVAGTLAGRQLGAAYGLATPQRVAIPARSRQAVGTFIPPLVDPAVMRALATTAIEAAVHAGADFADIRLGDQRHFGCNPPFPPDLRLTYGYGIRVRVGGGNAFIGGADPTPERLVAAARSAVATARGLAQIAGPAVPLAPSPVVTGEWAATTGIDPFTVSPDDHFFALLGLQQVNDAAGTGVVLGAGVTWVAETRVFASSEGSLVTQHLARALPVLSLIAGSGRRSNDWAAENIWYTLPLLVPSTVGFELVLGPTLHEQIQVKLRELEWWAKLPWTVPDVGRKSVVLDGQACAALIGATLLPALSLDRVLGEEQDASGTSFLTPTAAILGQPLFSPHLNLAIATGGTSFGRMQWDDEGVVPKARPLIQHGMVVDYLGTRANLHALAPWYAQQQRPLRPPGGLWTDDVSLPPLMVPGQVEVASVATGPSLLELAQAMRDGVVVRDCELNVDHQGLGGLLAPKILFEVRKGKVTRRLAHTHLEFSTKKVFKDIIAVGGPTTIETLACHSVSGVPPAWAFQAVAAPAVQFREANLVASGLGTSS